ncbi:peptidyl-prolyl cis-trans isomerase [Pendulispora brunnea]|uniref:Peptidyl-prolyl cis-trans isomerase n=1 Tax=Pendulispora brunnea TaxID=2905690 RepID=A0ABZ2KJU3_9BACT
MSESQGSARTAAIGLGVVVAVLALVLAFKGGGSKTAAVDAGVDAGAVADAALDGAGTTSAEVDAGGDPFGLDGVGSAPTEREDRLDSGIGATLPDGTPVPPLPNTAPRAVRLGVILVTYEGAQGAPAKARSKAEAKELAAKLAAEAKTDFHAAVSHGDSGSADDLGRIPRGTLELAPEYVLFTMPSGQTSEPIDTPRGFWIVKRLD